MPTFKFYTDPGHGWLRVTPADVYELGITRSHFTPYSYCSSDDKYWYLEEDCDAGTFIRAWEKKNGTKFRYTTSGTNGRSSVRSKAPLWNYSSWDRDAWNAKLKDLETV